MRIVGGSHRGRRLSTPRWEGLRPTSERLRETLFDILNPRVAGARVLDGCAGTGAVGLEALSRGAAHVVFIDRDPRATALIRRNAAACGLAERCTIRRGALPAAFRRVPGVFDLVLLDPPYGSPDVGAMLAAAAACLAPDSRLVVEHARRSPPPVPPVLEPLRSVRAGDSVLRFYRPAESFRAGGEVRDRRLDASDSGRPLGHRQGLGPPPAGLSRPRRPGPAGSGNAAGAAVGRGRPRSARSRG